MRFGRKAIVLGAVLSAAALLSATPGDAAPGDNPGPLIRLTGGPDLAKLNLQRHIVPASSIAALDAALPNVGVATVLAAPGNHQMRAQSACDNTELAALPKSPQASRVYCWAAGDATTQRWLPQSVTSSGDADDDGQWGPSKVILSGWTHNDSKAGEPAADRHLARVAFIDANTLKYRWMLLTVPINGGTNFKKLESHLGGMVWYGDKLYVTARNGADHNNAIYVFSMKHILQATVNGSAVGKVAGGFSAHGYQYVMPAIGSYSLGGICGPATDDGYPCFASISLDRSTTPDSLVANEWFSSGGTQPARVFRYRFGSGAMLAADSAGVVRPWEAYETKAVGVQGVISHNGVWYVDDARGGVNQHGILWRQTTSGATAKGDCGTDQRFACWAQHSESMSLWSNTDEIWSLTEWAANAEAKWAPPAIPQRVLFAMPRGRLD